MALALSQAASVKAEIRLHQALKQFSLALEPRHQAEFNIFKSQSAPTFETVIELSIQVSRDGRYQHAGGWLPKFGPRLEPLLHRIQLFSTAGDLLIGGSQNLIASGVWACVRLFLKVREVTFSVVRNEQANHHRPPSDTSHSLTSSHSFGTASVNRL